MSVVLATMVSYKELHSVTVLILYDEILATFTKNLFIEYIIISDFIHLLLWNYFYYILHAFTVYYMDMD